MLSINSLPYSERSYSLIINCCQDTLTLAVNNGVISRGAGLDSIQKIQLEQEAALDISNSLYLEGYYFQMLSPPLEARQNRETPIATLIGLLVDDFLAWKNSGNALFSGLYESLDKFWNRLKDFREFIGNLFNYIADRFSSMWNGIGNQMSKVKNILAKPFKFMISSREERNVNTNENNRKSSMPLLYNHYPGKTNNDSANNINNNSSTINISNIAINTRATDAKGIADSLLTEIQRRTMLMNQSNYGIR